MKKNFSSSLTVLLLAVGLALTLALPVSARDKHGDKAAKAKAAAAAAAAKDVEAVLAVFNTVLEISSTAVSERGAIPRLEPYFDADVTIIDNSGLTRGWETYKTRLLNAQLNTIAPNTSVSRDGDATAEPTQPTQPNHRVSEVSARVSGDFAVVTYQYKLTAFVKGQAMPIFGYGTTVMTRSGGGWKIIHTQNAGRKEQSYDPKF